MAKEKSKFNLKDQLAGIAALVAAIVAIGGGFVKYGEITTKLNALSEQTAPDLTPMAALIGENNKNIAVLQTEIELLNLMIKEMKAKADNPLQ
jgi:hypothetical protein|tara:strand:- start:105 stop:383 length:279 start_codon:yes stop_codon:yes gene_type:complete